MSAAWSAQTFPSTAAAAVRPALWQIVGALLAVAVTVPVAVQFAVGVAQALAALSTVWLVAAVSWALIRLRRRRLEVTEDGRLLRVEVTSHQGVDLNTLQRVWLHPDRLYWSQTSGDPRERLPAQAPQLWLADADGAELPVDIDGVWDGDQRWAALLLDAADKAAATVTDNARIELAWLAGRRYSSGHGHPNGKRRRTGRFWWKR